MASEAAATFSVTCPCCAAELVIDPATRSVLHSAPALAPPPITDLAAEVSRLRSAGAQPEQALESVRTREERMDRKFDELLSRAKQTPEDRPLKDIDL